MPNVTITLSDEAHRALCEQAAARGISVDALIAQRLEADRARTAELMAILDQAQEHFKANFPDMTEEEVTQIAVEEVRAYRAEKAAQERRAASGDR